MTKRPPPPRPERVPTSNSEGDNAVVSSIVMSILITTLVLVASWVLVEIIK